MPRPDLDELRRSVTQGRAVLERSRATLARVRRMLSAAEGGSTAPAPADRAEGGRSGGERVRNGEGPHGP